MAALFVQDARGLFDLRGQEEESAGSIRTMALQRASDQKCLGSVVATEHSRLSPQAS